MGFQQGFRINTNTSSLDTYRNYSASQAGMERNIERLSSGLRINKAADDSAGRGVESGEQRRGAVAFKARQMRWIVDGA